jgi:glycosyltransferase involved in cell wall biosynthesis
MVQTAKNGKKQFNKQDVETAALVPMDVPQENGVVAVRKGDRRRHAMFPILPDQDSVLMEPDTRPVLVVFCFEDADSVVGRFVSGVVSALARRDVAVHLFSQRDFALVSPSVVTHALGRCEGDDLPARVQEFAGRACNAFLKRFQGTPGHITLMGFEWSTIPVLSLLRGIKNLDVFLSLHSLERQRSDMSSEISGQIAQIKMCGLREAKVVLVHEAATAEVAQSALPECATRIVQVRELFSVEPFAAKLDAGAVKARYQVGPIDPTILFVGDLSERYGPDLLVKAMPAVLKNHKQARLIIVGEGEMYWPLRVYTRYLLLEHAVRLVGHVEGQSLHELIESADIVAVPSREATPWWPIQAAWAARRPLVATHQAAPGLLEHERDAVLVYPSENSCVWGIERVLFDAGLRQALADRGGEKLDDRFGWGSVAAQVEELMTAAASR